MAGEEGHVVVTMRVQVDHPLRGLHQGGMGMSQVISGQVPGVRQRCLVHGTAFRSRV